MRIGLISDTHGLMRGEVKKALAGASIILHAGDVGSPSVLRQLREIAPTHAVFGNVDDPHDPDLHRVVEFTVGGLTVHVSHGHELGHLTADTLLRRYSADILIFGHTHRALIERSGRRLVINPGSAGPRRFDIQPSVARLVIDGGKADAEIVWLGSPGPRSAARAHKNR